MTTNKPALWTPGDWNAFFGFGTNILVNMLVLTGLLRFVLKMPDDLVFGRILPAAGLMMALSTTYYAWLAYRLAQKTGRTDVCALPSGISVPHMFVVVFVIMLPISLKTGDPVKGWEAGLRVGVRAELRADGRRLRRADRAQDHAARGPARHARRRVDRVHLDAARGRDVHDAGHRHRVLCDHPGELVRRRPLLEGHPRRARRDRRGHYHRVGRNRVRRADGWHERGERDASASQLRILAAVAGGRPCVRGLRFPGPDPVTAIPFGIYDLVEAMDNVESAAAAGDSYPTTRVLTADGVVSLSDA